MAPAMMVVTAVMVLPALTACFSGLNSKLPAQQRYVLQPAVATPPAAAAARTGSVEVLRPSAAAGLGGDGIAVLRPGARLDYYSNARWAGDAPSTLQALVIESLRNADRFATVESDSGPFASQYILGLELEHFEAQYRGDGPPSIELTLVCSLGRRSDRTVIVSFTAHSSVQADADRMQAVIAAFEQATAQALAQVTANIGPPTAAAAP
jgi:cholesterol transport system auxiliary component